jgi:serine/threonine protein kinase
VSLKPGDTVEHFTIVSSLGQGGMGQVYLARDTRLLRSVALKIVHPGDASHPSAQGSDGAARLLREAQSAAALEHPNVVTIYEVGEVHTDGEERGRPYIAMELVKGRSLRTFVGDASVPLARRTSWLADIARALAAAHRAGLVHRDIKPENVMVRDDGVIKVLDFGVAKRAVTPSMSSTTSTEAQVLPSLTAKGVAVGTPYYMAPEQMRREGLDGRADQFSWGVVAYELLSGAPAWGRDVDALELVSKLLTEDPAPLEAVCPDVPGHVAKVVARAMAKKRVERFATMEDLLAALEDHAGVFAATMPGVSLPPPPPDAPALLQPEGTTPQPITQPSLRRRRTVATGIALASVLLAAGALWLGAAKRAATAAAAASASAAAAKPECTRATECVAKLGGKPAVCGPTGKCAAIESAECKAEYEPDDLKRDDTVWIGAMFPTSGAQARFGVSNSHAVELGRRDFAQASVSLRAPDGSPLVRPLAVVDCDDASAADRVAEHLVHDLGVPAVLGIGGRRSVQLTTSLFVPNDVLTVPSLSQSPLFASIPHAPGQPRMVWRTTYDNAEAARAIAALVERLESELRARGELAAKSEARIAVVRRRSPSNALFAEKLFEAARFNGRPALENGPAYREFSVAPDEDEDDAEVARQVALFAPTFIVFAVQSDFVAKVEAAWPPGAKPRPYYVSPSVLEAELLGFLGTDAARRRRVFGLTTVSTTTTNARFVVHYNESFADAITRTWAPNSSYDAFYLAAYAAYALGQKPVTGRALAESIARLVPPGQPIEVGPSGILGAFAALSRGRAIDLIGATGSLDFDLKTGEASIDLAVLCAGTDAGGRAGDAVESGLVFDAKGGRLAGELRCP